MGKQHIIELNGKRYDAITGRQVATSTGNNIPAKQPVNAVKNMDGFSRRSSHPPRKVSATSKPHHQLEKAKTLMRHTVHKPAVASKQQLAKVKPAAHVSPAHTAVTEYERLSRAQKTPRSHLIQHFGVTSASAKTAAVKIAEKASAPAVHSVEQQPTSPFSKAVENAISHLEPKAKRAKAHHRVARKLHISPRVLNAGALSLALVLVVGFFAYQNIPNLAMRVAAMRAQVEGSLPAYKPSGFSLNGSIQYQPGQIIVGYKSNSDERNFQLTQRSSAWDSQSLLENYVAPKNQQYQTVQDKGKTVYLYEGSNATWVDSGIWYTVEGDSKLNSDQLLRLAASL